MSTDEGVNDIDMGRVCDLLVRRGIPAYVEMTGGGVATIYAGTQRLRLDEWVDWPRWSAIAGPGTIQHRDFGYDVASTCDFYIGPDDDGEADYVTVRVGASHEEIVDLIEAEVRKWDSIPEPPFLIDKEGDVWEAVFGGWTAISTTSPTYTDADELCREWGPFLALTTDPRPFDQED